jgi:hypothetical protein
MGGVAWRKSQRFSTNIKVGHEFEQWHLEAEFGQSNFSEPPRPLGGKMDVEFFSIESQKKLVNFKFVLKSYGHFTEPPLSFGFEGAVPTRMRNRVKQ